MNAGMRNLLREAAERGITLTVIHACGHWGLWRLVLGETTVEEAQADLERRKCFACIHAEEQGAEWS
jgi:hypothetical protein